MAKFDPFQLPLETTRLLPSLRLDLELNSYPLIDIAIYKKKGVYISNTWQEPSSMANDLSLSISGCFVHTPRSADSWPISARDRLIIP